MDVLAERFEVEADFFVRHMLTWAVMRHPAELMVSLLIAEATSAAPQARSQALHTLSKVGDPRGWHAVTEAVMQDADTSVARAAWRAGVILVPVGSEGGLAPVLSSQPGRGDRDVQLGLARALAELGDHAVAALEAARTHPSVQVRAQALAIGRLIEDPEETSTRSRCGRNRLGRMSWSTILRQFAAGVLLVNAIPHGVAGVQGRRFTSPFARPPGRGLSSPTVNVVWSAMNAVAGSAILGRRRTTGESVALGAGGLVMAVFLSRYFGQVDEADK